MTTLLAGKAVARFGTRPAIWGALALAAIGLPLMLSSHLAEVLAAMVLVGAGMFFARPRQPASSKAANETRSVASRTYLACYFLGGSSTSLYAFNRAVSDLICEPVISVRNS